MSNWYFYAQTGKSEWLPELADRRDEYIEIMMLGDSITDEGDVS